MTTSLPEFGDWPEGTHVEVNADGIVEIDGDIHYVRFDGPGYFGPVRVRLHDLQSNKQLRSYGPPPPPWPQHRAGAIVEYLGKPWILFPDRRWVSWQDDDVDDDGWHYKRDQPETMTDTAMKREWYRNHVEIVSEWRKAEQL